MKFEKDVIDSHVHLYNWFSHDGRSFIELLDELQETTGIKGINIAALTDEKYGGVESNIMAAIYKLHNPTAYAYANLFYPSLPLNPPLPDGLDIVTQYKEFKEIGFDGMKILYKPDMQKRVQLPINDEFFDEFFTLAEKDGTHFIWHVADPEGNWEKDFPIEQWNYSDGTYLKFDEMYAHVFDVLERHPLLNVCFAHFFFLENYPERLEEIFAKYKNVCIDVVPGLMFRAFEKNPEFYREFLIKYSDRILFGSDSEAPYSPDNAKLMTAVYEGITTDKIIDLWGYKSKGINLPDEAAEKILYHNFRNKCHPKPQKINKEALENYIEKYNGFILKEENKRKILEFKEML